MFILTNFFGSEETYTCFDACVSTSLNGYTVFKRVLLAFIVLYRLSLVLLFFSVLSTSNGILETKQRMLPLKWLLWGGITNKKGWNEF